MKDKLFEYYINESKNKFEGWDFNYINSRVVESPLPWSYRTIILPYILQAKSLLDMGTGGGEFLSKLPIPEYTCSTESYPPNIAISKNRLQPLGVNVLGINNDNKLPFGTDTFEVVINRQEYYSPSEVYRILKPDGFFVTQQVGAKDGLEINEILNAPMPEDHNPDWTLNFIIDELTEKKFKILYSFECRYTTRIYDIGALIYYLKAIPWQIPDFSVDLYYSELYSLHNRIEKTGYSDVTSERFLIVTKK